MQYARISTIFIRIQSFNRIQIKGSRRADTTWIWWKHQYVTATRPGCHCWTDPCFCFLLIIATYFDDSADYMTCGCDVGACGGLVTPSLLPLLFQLKYCNRPCMSFLVIDCPLARYPRFESYDFSPFAKTQNSGELYSVNYSKTNCLYQQPDICDVAFRDTNPSEWLLS